MTRSDPRGAENWGAEREKMARSSVGVEEKCNSRFRLFPFIMLPSLSLSSADSHTASLCCTQLNVLSSKLSILPDCTPAPSCPANVSSASH